MAHIWKTRCYFQIKHLILPENKKIHIFFMISPLHFTVLTSQSCLCVNIVQEAKNEILIHFISSEFNSTILHRTTENSTKAKTD